MQGLLKNLFVRPAALTAMALQQSLPGSFEIDALAKEVRDVLGLHRVQFQPGPHA